MSNTDPFIEAADEILTAVLGDVRAAISGLSEEALNWRPAGEETNSIAVLTTHAMHSTRSWVAIAVGAQLPDRDRPSEFLARADAAALLALVDSFGSECQSLLGEARDVDWSAPRKTHPRMRTGAPEEQTSAWAIMHALEHLREHSGQMSLTRQLWEARRL